MSICERLVQGLSDYFVLLSSVRDDLVTDDGNQVLSARQGMVLKNLVDSKVPVIVESASVETCVTPDVPVPGYEVGDRYIDFLLNDENESHVYELLTELPLSDVATQTWVREYIDSLDGSSIEYPL